MEVLTVSWIILERVFPIRGKKGGTTRKTPKVKREEDERLGGRRALVRGRGEPRDALLRAGLAHGCLRFRRVALGGRLHRRPDLRFRDTTSLGPGFSANAKSYSQLVMEIQLDSTPKISIQCIL